MSIVRSLPAALLLLAPIGSAFAQDGALPASRALYKVFTGEPLPGSIRGTERWIVHFETRPFDLSRLHAEMHGRRSFAAVEAIVADSRRRMLAHQAEFVREIVSRGGRAFLQYWLVNAAAIEIDPRHLPAIRALANVDFLQPDVEVRPTIKTATNSNNHGADSLQAAGHRGNGVTVAVIDTGQDERCGFKPRPHIIYSRRGNAAQSRLVVNRKLGAAPADDVTGHGTGVASIAAGWKWRTSTADHGHAYDADIAGYAIANDGLGRSSVSIMAQAYQLIAGGDAARYNIVASNLSYTGSPSPLSIEQKAADQAARTVDLLVCTGAANSGWNTQASQINLNGLSVGACSENSKTIASFSSRGLIFANMPFPDICANGVMVDMALRNDENRDWVANGTSMASPQVCGAATQLRARYPALKSDGVKAILLAATLESPGTGNTQVSNGPGAGYLHSPSAHTIAGNGQRHGRATLSNGTRTWTRPMPVAGGRRYQVAIAWHRLNVNASTWSNLDLTIKNGPTTIIRSANSTSTLEFVRFTAASPATYTIEVTATSLSATQPFAWAATSDTSGTSGTYTLYGQGCRGTGGSGGQSCISVNDNITTNTIYPWFQGAWFWHECHNTTGRTISVRGFRFLCRSSSVPQTIATGIFTAVGNPPTAFRQVASGQMAVGTSSSRYPTSTSPTISFAKNATFYIGYRTPLNYDFKPQAAAGNFTPYYWSGNRPPIRWLNRRFAWSVTCTAPGTAVPRLRNVGAPTIGGSFVIDLSEARPDTPATLLFGLSRTNWAGLPLPFDLAAWGAPGCFLHASGEFQVPGRSSAAGTRSVTLLIPNHQNLIGLQFYNQYAVFDGPANRLGLVTTNGGAGRIGN